MSLTVDEATASRFARACRLEAMWERKVIPTVFVAAALIVIVDVIEVMRNDLHLIPTSVTLGLILAATVLIGRSVLTLLRSRHHPRLMGRGFVLIRDVDRETAQIWADLNSRGAINILG